MSVAESVTTSAPAGAAPAPARTTWSGRLSGRLLWSELGLIGGRRRNQMGLLVLAAVPVLMAVAVRISAPRSARGARRGDGALPAAGHRDALRGRGGRRGEPRHAALPAHRAGRAHPAARGQVRLAYRR